MNFIVIFVGRIESLILPPIFGFPQIFMNFSGPKVQVSAHFLSMDNKN